MAITKCQTERIFADETQDGDLLLLQVYSLLFTTALSEMKSVEAREDR